MKISSTTLNKYSTFSLFLLFTAIAFLICIADRAPIHLDKEMAGLIFQKNFDNYLFGVVERNFPRPYVYRILVPFLVFGANKLLPFLTALTIDFIFKAFFLTCVQFSFFYYLKHFFSKIEAVAGVLFLDVLISYSLSSIQGPTLIETGDIFNLFIFIILFISLYRNNFPMLYLSLFVGTFNRETTWISLPFIFVYEGVNEKRWVRPLFAMASVAIPYFGLRLFYQAQSTQWFSLHYLGHNIPFISSEHTINAIVANIHVLFLLGPLIALSMYKFREHPLFLRIVSCIVPLFIVIHYVVGAVIESRIWIPLFPILIPMVINNLRKIFGNELPS